MSRAKNATEVLIAAKWILENVGWIKYQSFAYANGKYLGFCATGAVNIVEASDANIYYAHHFLNKVIGSSIVRFNDLPTTTKQEVLEAFDQAIKESTK